jgi:hypothetical protein
MKIGGKVCSDKITDHTNVNFSKRILTPERSKLIYNGEFDPGSG